MVKNTYMKLLILISIVATICSGLAAQNSITDTDGVITLEIRDSLNQDIQVERSYKDESERDSVISDVIQAAIAIVYADSIRLDGQVERYRLKVRDMRWLRAQAMNPRVRKTKPDFDIEDTETFQIIKTALDEGKTLSEIRGLPGVTESKVLGVLIKYIRSQDE